MSFDLHNLGNLLVVYGINVLGAVAIAAIGWWTAGLFERLTRRALMSIAHMDATVGVFLASLAYYGVLVLTFVLILQVIGVQATSLVAVLGAASLAIGLALQGTLSNMAAGVMLLLFRPFHLGDSIEVGGKSGTVKNLNLFMTELASGDNVQVLIPNGQVWGTAITNLSAYSTRIVSIKFPVPYGKNLQAISGRLQDYLESDRRVLPSPSPSITVSSLTNTGIEISVQAWTASAEAGPVRAEFAQRVLEVVQEPELSAAAE
ncbi:mechanosensitive ion channel family protein [Labrys monachus]|uniref:Small-conductance mechanosensitive channel n=1 Tax=Labrys monachus TaxID=217067 RepID=A0ABU0FEN8_9HYPH|nr:mechanosensitive ion channel domain-containing protein [Labrys monachus]MDQ0393079.1 small conductance mechanosensitive channel [Labrys monachus]